MQKVLYIFGGERASGAEIVMDRLMRYNQEHVEPHLFVSPGSYADQLLLEYPYHLSINKNLKKLNRVNTSAARFIIKALQNYVCISLAVLIYIRKFKIKVVHANTIVPASYLLPAIILSKLSFSKVKWLWSDHDLTYFSKRDKFFANLNFVFFDKTVVVSHAVKDKFNHKSSQHKIQVLYNGLDPEYFKPNSYKRKDFRKQNNIPDGSIVFGIAGTLSVRKGQLSLARIFANQFRNVKTVYLLIAGGMAEEDKLYAQELVKVIEKNSHFIKYLGKVNNMLSFYNGCDIIISNSNVAGSEPLGTTIYEAMACEKLVIASDTGGTKEIIDNWKNGLLFDADDETHLKKVITYCLEGLSEMREIKAAARKTVIDKFNIEHMSDSYNKILDSI